MPYADTTSASRKRRFTGREREDTLSVNIQTKGASRPERPTGTCNVIVLQTETSQSTADWIGENGNGMSPKQKVSTYVSPHEMNEFDIRQRSAINGAIDADKC